MQYMKKEFSKDTKILKKKIKLKFWNENLNKSN
jgi:hypothetical protein